MAWQSHGGLRQFQANVQFCEGEKNVGVPISGPLGGERRVRPTAPLTILVHHTFVRCQMLGVGRIQAATILLARARSPIAASSQMTTREHLSSVLPPGTIGS